MLLENLLILALVGLNQASDHLNDETKVNLISKIKQNFRESLRRSVKSDSDLKSFQHDLIFQRNSKCMSKELFRLSFDDLHTSQIFLSNLSSNVDELAAKFTELVF